MLQYSSLKKSLEIKNISKWSRVLQIIQSPKTALMVHIATITVVYVISSPSNHTTGRRLVGEDTDIINWKNIPLNPAEDNHEKTTEILNHLSEFMNFMAEQKEGMEELQMRTGVSPEALLYGSIDLNDEQDEREKARTILHKMKVHLKNWVQHALEKARRDAYGVREVPQNEFNNTKTNERKIKTIGKLFKSRTKWRNTFTNFGNSTTSVTLFRDALGHQRFLLGRKEKRSWRMAVEGTKYPGFLKLGMNLTKNNVENLMKALSFYVENRAWCTKKKPDTGLGIFPEEA